MSAGVVAHPPLGLLNKPWLFLDLDGVISPVPTQEMKADVDRGEGDPPPGFITWEGAPYRMYVSEHLSVWASQLDDAFDVVWSSSWRELLLEGVAKPLGLERWPVLSIPFTHQGGTYAVGDKAAAIREHADKEPRPFSWCDDYLYRRPEGAYPAFDRTPPHEFDGLAVPFLLIKPCSRVGLTQAHIDHLLRFAAAHRSADP
jgi:hypothetical protein